MSNRLTQIATRTGDDGTTGLGDGNRVSKDSLRDQLPRLKEYILPAGTRSAALAHVARTIARRAERAVVALAAGEAVRAEPRHYLNRLSDLLFVLARVLNRANLDGLGGDDVYWNSERLQQQDAAE